MLRTRKAKAMRKRRCGANELERTDDEWSGGSDMDEDDEEDKGSISAALPKVIPAADKATKPANTAAAKPAPAEEK